MELRPTVNGEQALVLENRNEIDLARFALHASASRLRFRPRLRAEARYTAAIMAGVLRARNSQHEGTFPDSLTLSPDETKRTLDALHRAAGDSKAPDDFARDVRTSLQSLETQSEQVLSS
jgi:hypothetical protein